MIMEKKTSETWLGDKKRDRARKMREREEEQKVASEGDGEEGKVWERRKNNEERKYQARSRKRDGT